MQNFWGQVKQAASAGILSGGYPYTKDFWYVGNNAPVFARRVDTIAQALNIMQAGDVLMLGPQIYTEGDLVCDVNDVTIIGTGNRGECSIAPSAAAANGLLIKSTGVTLINVDIAQGSGGTYACKAGFDTTASLNRFSAYRCKFEGNGIGLHMHGMSDSLLEECEFAWATHGLQFQSNSHGFCTEVYVKRCLFHDNVTADIDHAAAAQQVDGLWVEGCIHPGNEGGGTPTKFINLSDNANIGLFTQNAYKNATNQASKLAIGTGIFWVANATEAGWSTARPA